MSGCDWSVPGSTWRSRGARSSDAAGAAGTVVSVCLEVDMVWIRYALMMRYGVCPKRSALSLEWIWEC